MTLSRKDERLKGARLIIAAPVDKAQIASRDFSGFPASRANFVLYDGLGAEEGDIIGLDDKKILAKGTNVDDTLLSLVAKLKDSSHEIITLYYGKDVSEEDAEALAGKLAEQFPDCDVDFHYGGQPIYYYIVSLE